MLVEADLKTRAHPIDILSPSLGEPQRSGQ